METIKLYHATNVSKSQIGLNKKTMYFTGNIELAQAWGNDHYEDFDILSIEVPAHSINIFEGFAGREKFINHDFEIMELPEMYENVRKYWSICGAEVISHSDSSDGYIVLDVTKYELKYA